MGWYVTALTMNLYTVECYENATDASDRFDFKVTAEELNQYIPCKLGLIPDGDNRGTSRGDVVTFTNTGNGWRIGQIIKPVTELGNFSHISIKMVRI